MKPGVFERTKRRVWVTKAWREGPILVEVTQHEDTKYVYGGPWRVQYVVGRTAFDTLPEAIERCNVLRANKLKSLQREIQKLERLDFSKVDVGEQVRRVESEVGSDE